MVASLPCLRTHKKIEFLQEKIKQKISEACGRVVLGVGRNGGQSDLHHHCNHRRAYLVCVGKQHREDCFGTINNLSIKSLSFFVLIVIFIC